jgi:hypothetical protein
MSGVGLSGAEVTPPTTCWGWFVAIVEPGDGCKEGRLVLDESVATAAITGGPPPGNVRTPSRPRIPHSSRTPTTISARAERALGGPRSSRLGSSAPDTGRLVLDTTASINPVP